MSYIPDQGDIIWLNREQDGYRSSLVLSPHVYNRASELMIAYEVKKLPLRSQATSQL